MLLSGCASSYTQIKPNELRYYNTLKNDSITISYENKVLEILGNTRNAKKSRKKGLQVMAIKVENFSSDTLSLMDDIVLESDNKEIKPVSTLITYKALKQQPATYLLALANFSVTVDSRQGTSLGVSVGLLNLLYVVPNMIISSTANARMKKELKEYSVDKCVVPPNQVRSALFCYSDFRANKVKVRKINGVVTKFDFDDSRIINKSTISDYYFISKLDTFETYVDNLNEVLTKDRAFTEIRVEKYYYSNGNPRYIGIRAKHTLADNDNYYYKIGTWRYYHKNGHLKSQVDYDLKGETRNRNEIYDENGKLLEDKNKK